MTQEDFSSVSDLALLYDSSSLSIQTARIAALKETFKKNYGCFPEFIARSPGRVNLIGEHIDYSNYSVLPMALAESDILIAVHPFYVDGKTSILLSNVQNETFPDRNFDLKTLEEGFLEIDATKHEWSNYFKAGLKGILLKLQSENPVSMKCLVDGSVPPGAGVSSSSAFVCCSALAALYANNGKLSKTELTEVAIISERFVGVNSGGMDQSCSVLGQKDKALIISFFPKLAVEAISIPASESPVFVIAHTLVTSDKHVTAPVCYNLRVTETTLAALVLANATLGNCNGIERLRDVHENLRIAGKIKKTNANESVFVDELTYMEELVETVLTKKDGYSVEEISTLVGLDVKTLKDKYMSKFPIKADVFHLYKRARHVFSEAKRVYQFKLLCEQGAETNVLSRLGELMNESQTSCRDDFECSCPELDELAELARSNGAVGSRLTGAGWGGCTVSCVPENKLDHFLKQIEQNYYGIKNRKEYLKAKGLTMKDVLFSSKPGRGAVILKGI